MKFKHSPVRPHSDELNSSLPDSNQELRVWIRVSDGNWSTCGVPRFRQLACVPDRDGKIQCRSTRSVIYTGIQAFKLKFHTVMSSSSRLIGANLAERSSDTTVMHHEQYVYLVPNSVSS